MRICVFHSSYEGLDHHLAAVDSHAPDPGRYTDKHHFESRWIHKEHAKTEIDAAVAEGFDFYVSFMWGTHSDTVAGIEAAEYLESLNLPSFGVRSWTLNRSKLDLYQDCRKAGTPRVPGNTHFPLIVKPAACCASQFIDDDSVCHNQEELERALIRLNKNLESGRQVRKRALGHRAPAVEDIVVQEFISGPEYLCTVIEMNGCPIPLEPCKIHFPEHLQGGPDRFLTFEHKFHEDMQIRAVDENEDPALLHRIKQAAVSTFKTDSKHGDFMGCDVDVRVNGNGEVIVLEVNPMPVAFLPEETGFSDVPIFSSLPGGHRAVVDIFIANYFLAQQLKEPEHDTTAKIAATYDVFSERYDEVASVTPIHSEHFPQIIAQYDFEGSLLDVGCGTGGFGMALQKAHRLPSQLVGFDVSAGMISKAKLLNIYDELIIGRCQDILPRLDGWETGQNQGRTFDHVVCFEAITFVSPIDLSLVLTRMFQLAKKSVTISADEFPQSYNSALADAGYPHMRSHNHTKNIEAFDVQPYGWVLKKQWKVFAYHAIHVKAEIFSSLFRFERVEGSQKRKDQIGATAQVINGASNGEHGSGKRS